MTTRGTPARPVLLRQLNDQRVIEELIARGPRSRTQLAIETGLSKPTISEVIARLEGGGLVHLVGLDSGRPGPNSSLYDLPTSRWLGAAYSLAVGRVTGELVSVRGERLSGLGLSLRGLPRDPRDLIADLNARLLAGAGSPGTVIGAIAVGVPGAYDPDHDRIAHLDGLPAWKSPGISGHLGGAVGSDVRVSIENDANLALLAVSPPETAGPGVTCLLWMADGVGLAISVAGTLFTGSAGRAGEIGYVPVLGSGELPTAGATHPPSLQDLISSGAAARLADRLGVPGRTGVDAVAFAVAHSHEGPSDRFLAELAERVALGVSVALAVLAPSEVILGGSLGSAGGAELARRTERALRSLTPLRTRVTHTPAGGDPVLAGAARRSTALLREAVLAEVRTP